MIRTNNKQNKRKKIPKKSLPKKHLQKKEKTEELISLEESESISNSEKEEDEMKEINNKQINRKRRISFEDKNKNKELLNKKKLKSNSKEKRKSRNKKMKKEEPEEIEDESEESEEEVEKEENEEIEEQNLNKKEEKFLPLINDKNENSNEVIKNKRKIKKKKIIEKINISDYKEDPAITIKDHNIIEDCCIECNEKNIFRAIKTNDEILFINCLKDKDKISKIINYELQMIKMNPFEYLIKLKNKTLLIEYINYIKKNSKESRVTMPKSKLKKLTSGKSDYYKKIYHTNNIGLSRGNKLGNNAFIISKYNEDFYYDLKI